MKDFSYITNSSPAFIENLYRDFVKDPDSVDPDLKKFFEGFDFAINNALPVKGQLAINNGQSATPNEQSAIENSASIDWMREIRAYRLILGYRNKGHLVAKTNPIRERKDRGANIGIAFYGFTEADLDNNFYAGNLVGLGTTSLKNILDHLEKCYAYHTGIEFKYISEQKAAKLLSRHWMRSSIQLQIMGCRKWYLEWPTGED